MIIYISELMIYTLISITLLFDLIIIINLSLFFWHKKNWQQKMIINWKFTIINLIVIFLNYVLIIICCLILFIPNYVNILIFSYSYKEALLIASLALIFYFFIRYLILVITINYCFSNNKKIIINLNN